MIAFGVDFGFSNFAKPLDVHRISYATLTERNKSEEHNASFLNSFIGLQSLTVGNYKEGAFLRNFWMDSEN